MRSCASSNPATATGFRRDDRPADDVTVAAAVLRGRVHDDVSAQGQRLLEVGRGERVVHRENGAGLMSHGREGGDVGDAQQRVGRRLDPDDLGLAGPDGGPHGLDVGDPGSRVLHPPRKSNLAQQAVGAAIGIGGNDHVVTGPQQRPDHGVLAGQTGGERETTAAALQCGEALLQRCPGRVGRTAVLVAAPKAADAVLLVRRDLVDRRHDGPGPQVRLLPRVDRTGVETSVVLGVRCARGGHVAKVTRAATTGRQALMIGDSSGQPQEERTTTRVGSTRAVPTGCSPTIRA